MDGFIIVIIIISVIISIVSGISKQAKNKGNAPQNRTYFPPLSVDDPQPPSTTFRPIEGFYVGPKVETEENREGLKPTEGPTSMEAVDYALKDIKVSQDMRIETRNPNDDLALLQAKAYKNRNEIPVIQKEQTLASHLKLFEGQDEFVKAVIYSEILRPRFKH